MSASTSKAKLNGAMDKVVKAFSRLDAAVEAANAKRDAALSEAAAGWQNHSAQLETAYAEANSENAFLKEDNLRLSNQLQDLQKEYLSLQDSAGDALVRLDNSIKQLDMLLEH